MTTPTEAPVPTGRELFAQIMAHITMYPQDWEQGNWMQRKYNSTCGTAGCIAGWACQMHGMTNHLGLLLPEFQDKDYDGHAIELLGLPERTGHALFGAGNTKKALYRIAAQLYEIEEEVLHKEVDTIIDEMRAEHIQWVEDQKKARRSAAAKRGWETRRAAASG